ncbi:hypothetical protein F5I97DRAFT_1927198 [Phlebopus sp. FC_14]|nr:hypothetical protein F5I97DRAFT_1927198 [Phlebopus sp. FC_14]
MVQARLFSPAGLILWSTIAKAQRPTYTATYTPQDAPYRTEQGQSGYNQCGTGYNQSSNCQNVYVNTLQDFCVWAPPEPGPVSVIRQTVQIEVAWCMKSEYGTRLIPDGTITGAHFVVTPDYVQVTGMGNLSNINIPPGDAGGELGPHGTTGEGNPVGALVFSNAFGSLEQIHGWTSFVSDNQFCFRACKPSLSTPTMCQHIYDIMGCEWNMPANYSEGVFETCLGDSAEPMGMYGSSMFYGGQPVTLPPPPVPSSSSCTFYRTISNGQGVVAGGITSTMSKPVPTVVRSHYHSQKNTHHGHFTLSATTITFPTPSSSPATLIPPDSTFPASLSPSTNIGLSGSLSMPSTSIEPSFSMPHRQSRLSEPTASFDPSTSMHSTMSTPWSPSALGSSRTPQHPLSSIPSSATSQSSSFSDLISFPSSIVSTSSQTSFSSSANSQGQIGSQCPVNAQAARMSRRSSSGGTRTTGSSTTILTASFVVFEKLVLTFLSVSLSLGSSVAVLVV